MTDAHLIFIQAVVRGFLARCKYSDLLSQDIRRINCLVNDTTLMGEKLDEIPEKLFYIIRDNNQNYGFNLEEIHEWVSISKSNTNPYTNNILKTDTINQIKRLYKKYIDENEFINNNNNNSEVEESKFINYNAELTNFFLKIESTGCYANMEGYKNLTHEQLWNFFKTLYEKYEIISEIIEIVEFNKVEELYGYFEQTEDSKKLEILENYFKSQVLLSLNKIFITNTINPNTNTDNENQSQNTNESRALVFTLHLSEVLSPNNDELEHFYLHNINFLIQNIINLNTFSEFSSESSEEDDLEMEGVFLLDSEDEMSL